MKRNTRIILRVYAVLLILLAGVPAFAQAPAPDPPPPGRPDFCGVWGIWGGEKISTEGRPWFKGVVVTANWRDIEPQPGRYDWTKLDAKVAAVTGKGLSVMLLVYHGHNVPGWIFREGGVPRVATTGKGPERPLTNPYYLDPAYMPLLSRLIHETAKHAAAYPPETRRKIVGVQCPTGKSGDPQPYEGEPLDERYVIDPHGKAWVDWSIAMFRVYLDAWKDFKPPFFLLFNGPEPDTNDWLVKNAPGSWRKSHGVAQGYQLNNESEYALILHPYTHGDRAGELIRTRGEFDNTGVPGRTWFNAAPEWNVYWTGLWVLAWGIDIWNQLPGVLEDPRHAPALAFVSRYAGTKRAADAPGAWVALRDGLDVADRTRFPEDRFGEYGRGRICSNSERYKKIAAEYAAFGARLDDPEHLAVGALTIRRIAKGLNDVGCHIWPGNYQMFMRQIDPQETSQGYWRVGPQDERFGRFARGFHHASGKDTLYFQVDAGFFPETNAEAGRRVKARVIYMDQGTGAWALHYAAFDNPDKTALTIHKTNSGHWKEAVIDIADGRFDHRGPRQADLWLTNPDDEDDIFHMVEIERSKP